MVFTDSLLETALFAPVFLEARSCLCFDLHCINLSICIFILSLKLPV